MDIDKQSNFEEKKIFNEIKRKFKRLSKEFQENEPKKNIIKKTINVINIYLEEFHDNKDLKKESEFLKEKLIEINLLGRNPKKFYKIHSIVNTCENYIKNNHTNKDKIFSFENKTLQ